MGHIAPQELDILCGRGGLSNKHAGNQLYLRIVQHNKDLYQEIQNPKHKHCLAISIIDAVQGAGARFLRQNKDTGTWFELSREQTLSKTLQALRERKEGRRTSTSSESIKSSDKKQQSQQQQRKVSKQPSSQNKKQPQHPREQKQVPAVLPTMTTLSEPCDIECPQFLTSSSALHHMTTKHKRTVTPECHVGVPYYGEHQQQRQTQEKGQSLLPAIVESGDEDDSSFSSSTSSIDSSCTPYQASSFDQLDLFDGEEWEDFETLLAPLTRAC